MDILGIGFYRCRHSIGYQLSVISYQLSVISYRDQVDVSVIQNWIEEAGNAAPLLFMAVYITGTVFFFPDAVLTLLGGALFGVLQRKAHGLQIHYA